MSMCCAIVAVFALAGAVGVSGASVRLSTGFIQGSQLELNDAKVNIFKSIPYAEPPVAELRFQRPKPKRSWDGTLDATEYASVCPSSSSGLEWTNATEDCLYLSVFADDKCLTTKCPVLFYIHGNAYQPFSSDLFDEKQIAERIAFDGIVFVRPAYRLGLFGFADFGQETPDYSYNNGLHDLILAVRWAQREIENFGGDPQRMTLMGSSFGADLALILLHSPVLGASVFHQAIVCSGLPRIGDGIVRNLTEKVEEVLECNNTEHVVERVLECVRNKLADDIEQATFEVDDLASYWGPRFDTDIIPANDHRQLLDLWKPIPLLIVHTSHEYIHPKYTDAREACESLMPILGYYSKRALDACVAYYLEHGFERVMADVIQSAAVRLARLNTAKGAPSYIGVMAEESASRHSGDLKFLVGLNPSVDGEGNAVLSEEDRLMADWYPRKIRNFVKETDGDWTPTDWHGASYYHFDFAKDDTDPEPVRKPEMMVGQYFNEAAVDFWLDELAEFEDADRRGESEEEDVKLKIVNQDETEDLFEGAAVDLRDNEEREEQVQFVWMCFWMAVALAVLLSLCVIGLGVCCLKERGKRHVHVKYVM